MARIALEERKQIEQRILEISKQLRIRSEENFPGGNVPYELSKDEIDALYGERDRLLKRLDEDVDLAA